MHHQKRSCRALRLGDLAAGQLLGDVGAALLGLGVAAHCGQVEPFVRLDHVDRDLAGPGRIGDAEFKTRGGVTARGVGDPPVDQELRAVQGLAHVVFPLEVFLEAGSGHRPSPNG